MKKIIIIAVTALMSVAAMAQETKYAYVDFNEIIMLISEKSAESLEVIDHEIGLSVTDFLFDHIVSKTLLITPLSDELAVLHMRLHILLSEFHSCELSEYTVADEA